MKFKYMRFRYVVPLVAVVVVVVLIFFYSAFKGDAVSREGYLYIPTGANYQTVVDSLERGDVRLKNMKKFGVAASAMSLNESVRPGRYRVKQGMSYTDVVRMLKHGLQTPVRLTFNNVRTLEQLAGRLAQQVESDSATLAGVLTADTTALGMGFTPQTFVAMFIPNTYEIYWNTSPGGIVARMKKEYDRFWTDARTAKLTPLGLTREQAVTLASIVYEESKMSDEMPIVAGVYLNRLRIGMPLQADPTVKFAIGDFTLRRILNRHLTYVSPYNTYINKGLPPGPICMPSIRAIDAVLDARKHGYLYFCAKPDFSGYHVFAATLSEHNRNAAAYSAALNKRKIFK